MRRTQNPRMTDTESRVVPQPGGRVHYLDWLRVPALGGVFLFHTNA